MAPKPCPVWLRWFVEIDSPFVRTNRAAEIIRRLNIAPGMRVLDVGCGPGRLTIPIANQVGPHGTVVAMDVQRGMLRRVQQKIHAAHLRNVQLVQAAAGEGALRAHDRMDRALLVNVLGELPDREAALLEIFDALVPHGVLSVTEVVLDPHFQKRDSVAELARAAGFRERAFFGSRVAFTMQFEKPDAG